VGKFSVCGLGALEVNRLERMSLSCQLRNQYVLGYKFEVCSSLCLGL